MVKGWIRNGVCSGVTTNYVIALSASCGLPAVYEGIDFSETHEDDID